MTIAMLSATDMLPVVSPPIRISELTFDELEGVNGGRIDGFEMAMFVLGGAALATGIGALGIGVAALAGSTWALSTAGMATGVGLGGASLGLSGATLGIGLVYAAQN